MPGFPVTLGCAVTITPGAAGPPDTGAIIQIPPPVITANGLPLATIGAICTMINSVSGATYPLTIFPSASTGVNVVGRGLLRMGDMILTPVGVITIVGPPAVTFVFDQWA